MLAPNNAWATAFSTNIHSHYHIVHTATTEPDFYWPAIPYFNFTTRQWGTKHPAENSILPTVAGFGVDVRYYRDASLPRPAGDPRQPAAGATTVVSMHHEVGFDQAPLDLMIDAAWAAGVKVGE